MPIKDQTAPTQGQPIRESLMRDLVDVGKRADEHLRMYDTPRRNTRAADSVFVMVKITGTSLGGTSLGSGKYAARSVSGVSTADADTADLSMPEGLDVAAADDTLFLFPPETGLADSHVLDINSYGFGWLVPEKTETGGYNIVYGIAAPVLPCP